MECKSCLSVSGEQRISPGKTIYEGNHWVVEHAYPTSLRGWLVIVPKRHTEALHELTGAEWAELVALQKKSADLLYTSFACQKEYILCLAESEGFKHIHFHIVPIDADLPAEKRGSKIFSLLKAKPLPQKEVKALCERLAQQF